MKVKIDNVEYQWNENDSFEKDGKTYSFASLKKVTVYKENKKFQTVTVKPEHVSQFKAFLKNILGDTTIHDEEVPF